MSLLKIVATTYIYKLWCRGAVPVSGLFVFLLFLEDIFSMDSDFARGEMIPNSCTNFE
jgi:hypothetical protein